MKKMTEIMKEGKKQLYMIQVSGNYTLNCRLNVNEADNNHNELQDSLLDYSDD